MVSGCGDPMKDKLDVADVNARNAIAKANALTDQVEDLESTVFDLESRIEELESRLDE